MAEKQCALTGDPNPEDIGPVIPDPWEDPEQTDWPMNPTKKEGQNELGTDQEPDKAPRGV